METICPDKLFFTSNTHFGPEMTLGFSKRPFTSSDEMDEALIKAWNDTVPEDGIVFHLGDFCDNSQYNRYTSRLNGDIHLIQGNHDRIAENQQFASISEQETI